MLLIIEVIAVQILVMLKRARDRKNPLPVLRAVPACLASKAVTCFLWIYCYPFVDVYLD
jgi:hypothetical protein